MNRSFLIWAILTVALAVILSRQAEAEDINHAKFLAQQAALPALGVADPFILRESWLKGDITPGNAKLVPQQLFKNNAYQFWFAVADSRAEVQLNLYDIKGDLVSTESVEIPGKENVISLIIEPQSSGLYYLRMAVTKESTSSVQDWALIYAYK